MYQIVFHLKLLVPGLDYSPSGFPDYNVSFHKRHNLSVVCADIDLDAGKLKVVRLSAVQHVNRQGHYSKTVWAIGVQGTTMRQCLRS